MTFNLIYREELIWFFNIFKNILCDICDLD
jgi:hypothetical protein